MAPKSVRRPRLKTVAPLLLARSSLRLLALLRHGERKAGELGRAVAVSQPNVSRSLQDLAAAGIVAWRPHGRFRVYSLCEASTPLHAAVLELLPHLETDDPEFAKDKKRLDPPRKAAKSAAKSRPRR